MYTVFTKVLYIFSMILLGLAAGKAKLVPARSSSVLVAYVLNIATPFLIIQSMASRKLDAGLMHLTLEVLVMTTACTFLWILVAYLAVRPLKYQPAADRGVLMVIISAINGGFMGYPIAQAVFGSEVFYLYVIANIIIGIYYYSFMYLQLDYGTGSKMNLRQSLRAMVNLPMIATVIGCVILFGGIRLPGPVMNFAGEIGDTTIPVSMVVVGLRLAESHPGQILKNYKLMIAVLAKLIAVPAATFLLINWLPLQPLTKLTITTISALPTAVVTVAVAETRRRNPQLMSEGVAMTTALSMATMPVMLTLFGHLYG